MLQTDFMMILFLDFDGVLHPHPGGELFSCTPQLWEILRRHPEAHVVFSTGWRFERPLSELRQLACMNGGEDLAGRFIDTTPLLQHDAEAESREKDCRAWLQARKHPGPWLALDDMPSLYARQSANLYAVNPKRGLMYYDAERISALLENHAADLRTARTNGWPRPEN